MATLRSYISSFAVAAVMSSTLLANAGPAEQTARATVKAWDLDLAKPSDVQTLYDRVHTAADRVCRAEEQRDWRVTRTRGPIGWRDRCVSAAVDGAVRDIASAGLTALRARADNGVPARAR